MSDMNQLMQKIANCMGKKKVRMSAQQAAVINRLRSQKKASEKQAAGAAQTANGFGKVMSNMFRSAAKYPGPTFGVGASVFGAGMLGGKALDHMRGIRPHQLEPQLRSTINEQANAYYQPQIREYDNYARALAEQNESMRQQLGNFNYQPGQPQGQPQGPMAFFGNWLNQAPERPASLPNIPQQQRPPAPPPPAPSPAPNSVGYYGPTAGRGGFV